MSDLIHPFTGLRALGVLPSGRVVWPVMGGSGDDGGEGQGGGKPDTGDTTDWKAEAEKWKALARKHEGQAKANYDELTQLKTAQDSTKSEQQKLTERIEAAERKAAEAEAKQVRAEVAAAKGVPAGLLSGSTKEELESYADQLLEFRGKKSDKDTGDKGAGGEGGEGTSGRPRERLLPGASSETDTEDDPEKLADAVLKAKRGF